MGKIDDMRKRREAQYAQQAGTVGTAAPAAAEPAAADSLTGKCAVCGKTLALQNGAVGSHQKGFGKFCPGSRKPAA